MQPKLSVYINGAPIARHPLFMWDGGLLFLRGINTYLGRVLTTEPVYAPLFRVERIGTITVLYLGRLAIFLSTRRPFLHIERLEAA